METQNKSSLTSLLLPCLLKTCLFKTKHPRPVFWTHQFIELAS